MSILKRYDPNGLPVFLTTVTFDRKPILMDLIGPLTSAYCHIVRTGVTVAAWVILPDHLHAIIELNERRLSDTVHRFKRKFSTVCRRKGMGGRLWQHRFWDHIIRDEVDFRRHVDYIHYNPVKHGLVTEPLDWEWSSVRRWMGDARYRREFGSGYRENGGDFGE